MPDRPDRLGAIARWLQQADEELLYTPDGEPGAGVVWRDEAVPHEALAWAVAQVAPGEEPPGGLLAASSRSSPPAWHQSRRCWDLGRRIVSASVRAQLQQFFERHAGMFGVFRLREIPEALRAHIPADEWDCLARFDAPGLWAHRFEPGIYRLDAVPLVEMHE